MHCLALESGIKGRSVNSEQESLFEVVNEILVREIFAHFH